MKILYIENHEIFARIVTGEFLSQHEVTITPTLSQAETLMEAQEFDLLLVDYDLDDGKGAEIVAAIAKKEPRPKIIAASSRENGNEFLMEAGADAICCKLHFNQIGSVIQKVLGLPCIATS
jgi:DNA-binding NarL/FixJ family response regulator